LLFATGSDRTASIAGAPQCGRARFHATKGWNERMESMSNDYAVKDIGLADFGRMEIEIA